MFAAAALLTHFLSPNTLSQAVPQTNTKTLSLSSLRAQGNPGNERTNNQSAGATLRLPKPDNTTRFLHDNINGINPTINNGIRVKDFYENLIHTETDIRSACELNTDTQQFSIKNTFHQQAKSVFGNGRYGITLASSLVKSQTYYKPGGTALIAQGNIRGRPISSATDDLGRWSYQILQGQSSRITVISAYQVCKKPTNKHGMAAYHQQEVLLHKRKRSNTDPRKNFHIDLQTFIQSRKALGDRIILLGDFNETLDDHHSNMLTIASECELIDPWNQLYPNQSTLPTYIRGSKRLDYALISPKLVQSITAIGYLPFHYLSSTNHRALFLDFDTNKLFGNDNITLASEAGRSFTSRDPKTTETYIDTFWNHAMNNNLFTKIDTALEADHVPTQLLEQIDAMITQCCDLADKACIRFRKPWWSQKLNAQRLTLSPLHRTKSCITNNTTTEGILQRCAENNLPLTLPTTLVECATAITTAQAEMDEIILQSRKHRDEEFEARLQLADNLDDDTKVKRIKAVKQTEHLSDLYRIFSSIRGKSTQDGLTRLSIPRSWPPAHTPIEIIIGLPDPKAIDDPQLWKNVTKPDEIEYYIQLRNRFHFGQAKGIPFTVPPLSDLVNWPADSQFSDDLLHGKADQSSLDTISDLSKTFLQECSASTELESIPCALSLDEFKAKLKVWRENTSTSPSGRHLLVVSSGFRFRLAETGFSGGIRIPPEFRRNFLFRSRNSGRQKPEPELETGIPVRFRSRACA
jgi:exonuclease III